MGISILYGGSLLPVNKPRKPVYILPYGGRIILIAHRITEPTWVGLGPIEPRALALGCMGPSLTHVGLVI